jgi:hypothetical protein
VDRASRSEMMVGCWPCTERRGRFSSVCGSDCEGGGAVLANGAGAGAGARVGSAVGV